MKLRSAVITTNPRSYEANLDKFPDLFPAFQRPDNQFATSSYHAFKSIKFPKKTNVWFSRYRPDNNTTGSTDGQLIFGRGVYSSQDLDLFLHFYLYTGKLIPGSSPI